ncbi:MAG: histone deacetylase [Myxococcota bacterium]|nr:histone deacetylase [Myxococcota bacterium]
MSLPNLDSVINKLKRWRKVDVWYHSSYRLPLSSMEHTGMEPRRADLAMWFLLESGATRPEQVHTPRPISYSRMARVHGADYLESLSDPRVLAGIFAAEPSEIVVDEVMRSVRLAVGGTVAAMRYALVTRGHTLNLLGGFHHAHPNGGGGFCPINDVAVAISVLRARGFKGKVAVLDLDAHPPDGTADCLKDDPAVWIGSLSGSDWGPLPNVDEVLLPAGTDDRGYQEALTQLLRRMPKAQMAFVLAGGDVVEGDKLGMLGLTQRGVRARDARVFSALQDTPCVWLPAGGYHSHSWKMLAGTGLVISGRPRRRIPSRYDPLSARFAAISSAMPATRLSSGEDYGITQDDVDSLFGSRGPKEARLLGFYTKEGVEFALFRFGFLEQVRRLGFDAVRIGIDTIGSGDRLRLYGTHGRVEDILVEMVLEKRTIDRHQYLFTNWLNLRNPRARFAEGRPALPGQDVPGLGLSREVAEVMSLMAKRLGLAGVAVRPAWYHVAYAGRARFRFVDPRRQGRFEALLRDLSGVPLLDATRAVAEGRVWLNGAPYSWEPDDYVFLAEAVPPAPEVQQQISDERDRCHFSYERPTGSLHSRGDA